MADEGTIKQIEEVLRDHVATWRNGSKTERTGRSAYIEWELPPQLFLFSLLIYFILFLGNYLVVLVTWLYSGFCIWLPNRKRESDKFLYLVT